MILHNNTAQESVPRLLDNALDLFRLGKLQEAETLYHHILKLAPDCADGYHHLGVMALHIEQADTAIELIGHAISLKEDNEEYHHNYGVACQLLGQAEKATEAFRRAIDINGNYGQAWHQYALSKRFTSVCDEEVEQLEGLLHNCNVSEMDQMLMSFAVGKMLDDTGYYDRAFVHYDVGNALKRKMVQYNQDVHEGEITRTIETFNQDLFSKFTGAGSTSRLPAYIVGMPRSGTTLVEQIMSSHPQVQGAGELNLISDTRKTIDEIAQYPEGIKQFDASAICALADMVLEGLPGREQDAEFIIDKMPRNFLDLGLIALMFPKTKIIHCVRHPLDTIISIYFQLFTFGNAFAYSLDNIAHYYYQYQRLMAHWREQLPVMVLDVSYEDLIAEPELHSRRIIEFLGLDWEPACLHFHKTQRLIKTASNWQVRQKIYQGSKGRWRNYAQQLKGLVDEFNRVEDHHSSGSV